MRERYFCTSQHRYLPIQAFLLVYAVTCLIGAMLLLFKQPTFTGFYEYFSGALVPHPNQHQTLIALVLLWVAPALLTIGFHIGTIPFTRTTRTPLGPVDDASDNWGERLIPTLFVVSAIVALISLTRGDAFAHLDAWVDYASFVQARWSLFQHIGFFEFANIYIFLPMLGSGTLILTLRNLTWKKVVLAILVAATTIGISLLLFQKRVAALNTLVMASALFTTLIHRNPGLARKLLWGGLAVATVAYFTLVILPSYRSTSRTIEQALNTCADENAHCGNTRAKELAQELGMDHGRTRQVLIYAAMSPFTRTSASALFYPIVYPAEHAFYGLDVGQDILGFGSMPDHASVIWHRMNPSIPGSASAPYQFILYSQVGTLGSLAGSLIIGLLLGFAWRKSQASPSLVIRALGAGCIVLFAIYLSMDGARDNVFSSYGLFWFTLPLIMLRLAHLLRRKLEIRVRQYKSS